MTTRARFVAAGMALLTGMLVGELATVPQAQAHGFMRYGFSFPVYGPRLYAPPPPPVVYEPPPPPVFVQPRVAFYAPPRIDYYAPPRIEYYAAPTVYRYRYRHRAVRHVRHVSHRQCVCQCCR